jgi:hypothetical protein
VILAIPWGAADRNLPRKPVGEGTDPSNPSRNAPGRVTHGR